MDTVTPDAVQAIARTIDDADAHSVHVHPHWETSIWPFVVTLGILLALPVAFSLHFVYQMPLAAVISLGAGVPLIVAACTGWAREALAHHGEGLGVPAMGWFIVAEALIFVSLFAAYWTMRLSAPSWPPAGSVPMPVAVPLIMTVLLVSSSFTIHVAEAAAERKNERAFMTWLLLTMLLGGMFLLLSGHEWSELMSQGFDFRTNAYSTAFFSITGFHGAHVAVGLSIFVAIALAAVFRRSSVALIKAGALYWHFVDIVWIFVVSQVYFW